MDLTDDDKIVLRIIREVCGSRATCLNGVPVCYIINLRFRSVEAGVEDADQSVSRLLDLGLIKFITTRGDDYDALVAVSLLDAVADAAKDDE